LDEATFETRLREVLALHPSRSARALIELDVLMDRPIDVDARQSTGPTRRLISSGNFTDRSAPPRDGQRQLGALLRSCCRLIARPLPNGARLLLDQLAQLVVSLLGDPPPDSGRIADILARPGCAIERNCSRGRVLRSNCKRGRDGSSQRATNARAGPVRNCQWP
jgi:hypothetical protein